MHHNCGTFRSSAFDVQETLQERVAFQALFHCWFLDVVFKKLFQHKLENVMSFSQSVNVRMLENTVGEGISVEWDLMLGRMGSE